MSSIPEHIAKLRALRANLPELSRALLFDASETLVALRKEDSIENGININGQEGSKASYSTNPVPTYYFKGKELNSGGRDYTSKNKTGTWYGLRQAEGLRSEKVNLTHTGAMWRAYGVIDVVISNGKVTARVGLSGPESEVFDFNVERYGAFFRNTPTELAQIQRDIERESSRWLANAIR